MNLRHSSFILVCSILGLTLAGCQIPQWRVFQKKIDPKLAQKPAIQIEAERVGAAYIRAKSAHVEPDPVEQISQIHQVATPLSQSLGAPKEKAGTADNAAVIAELRSGQLESQKRADEWKAFARKYAGTELEGTGLNLFTPTALLGFAGVVALCIFVPGFLTFLFFVIRRMRSSFQQVAQAVEEFQVEHPAEAKALKAQISKRAEGYTKKLITREKKYLDQAKLNQLRAEMAGAA